MQSRINIDEIDAKILKTLLEESRTSFTEIAKNCKISIAAVRMRYKRLWKTGIINGEIMQVNPHSLGYKFICNIGVITAIENESKVIEFLKSKTYVSRILENFGKYNIAITVAMDNTEKLSRIIEDLEANPLITHVDALIWAETVNMDHTENLVIKPFNVKIEQKHAPINLGETRIDEIDRQIAKILAQNSRISFRKIAKQLNISTKTVIQRYKRLRRENVLTLSTITVDLKKLGYNAIANLFIKAANRSIMPEIQAQLLRIPNLIVAVRYIGPYDLFAIVVLTDFEELFKLRERIRRIQSIEKADTYLRPPYPAWPLNLFASLLESN